jgi:hypothetical protein
VPQACPRCGAATEPLQEYCLECGLRLHTPGVVPALAEGWRRRLRWYPGDWIWPSLLALVVAGLASETLVGDTSQLPTTVETMGPTTAPTEPTTPTATTRTSTAPRTPAPRRLIEWPRGRSGWTLVLASSPTSAKREAAVAKAEQALADGLPQVGVIDSSRYSSLHPGYFVVFSGLYDSLSAAQEAASRAANAGYGNAYGRRITPKP